MTALFLNKRNKIIESTEICKTLNLLNLLCSLKSEATALTDKNLSKAKTVNMEKSHVSNLMDRRKEIDSVIESAKPFHVAQNYLRCWFAEES